MSVYTPNKIVFCVSYRRGVIFVAPWCIQTNYGEITLECTTQSLCSHIFSWRKSCFPGWFKFAALEKSFELFESSPGRTRTFSERHELFIRNEFPSETWHIKFFAYYLPRAHSASMKYYAKRLIIPDEVAPSLRSLNHIYIIYKYIRISKLVISTKRKMKCK